MWCFFKNFFLSFYYVTSCDFVFSFPAEADEVQQLSSVHSDDRQTAKSGKEDIPDPLLHPIPELVNDRQESTTNPNIPRQESGTELDTESLATTLPLTLSGAAVLTPDVRDVTSISSVNNQNVTFVSSLDIENVTSIPDVQGVLSFSTLDVDEIDDMIALRKLEEESLPEIVDDAETALLNDDITHFQSEDSNQQHLETTFEPGFMLVEETKTKVPMQDKTHLGNFFKFVEEKNSISKQFQKEELLSTGNFLEQNINTVGESLQIESDNFNEFLAGSNEEIETYKHVLNSSVINKSLAGSVNSSVHNSLHELDSVLNHSAQILKTEFDSILHQSVQTVKTETINSATVQDKGNGVTAVNAQTLSWFSQSALVALHRHRRQLSSTTSTTFSGSSSTGTHSQIHSYTCKLPHKLYGANGVNCNLINQVANVMT